MFSSKTHPSVMTRVFLPASLIISYALLPIVRCVCHCVAGCSASRTRCQHQGGTLIKSIASVHSPPRALLLANKLERGDLSSDTRRKLQFQLQEPGVLTSINRDWRNSRWHLRVGSLHRAHISLVTPRHCSLTLFWWTKSSQQHVS